MLHYDLTNRLPVDVDGFYGNFGGAFIPEELKAVVRRLDAEYRKCISDKEFLSEFDRLMHEYVGRPTPLR